MPRQISERFLVKELMLKNQVCFTYTHYYRIMAGSVVPASKKLVLKIYPILKIYFFLELSESGTINLDGAGIIAA